MASRAGTFRLDHEGIGEMLKSEPGIRALIQSGTEATAAGAEESFPTGFRILNGVVITDRPQGNVTVVNRSAEAMEGKHGYLSQAAQAAGFEGGRRK